MRLTNLLTNSTYQSLSADEVVKAEFYIRDGGSYYTDVEIHAIQNNTTWKENDAVWSNLCVTANISFATYATSLMGGGEWECFDITSLVKAWKNGTQNAQCGFMMVLADETKYVGTLSCEYGTGENWPYAVLTYDDNGVLSHTILELFSTERQRLTVQNPDNLALSWSSDDPYVAIVTNGNVTAKNPGTTTIRVSSSDGAINASCTVHVKIRDGVYYIKNAALNKYLRNSGGDAGVASQDTSSETKYRQLWKIIYISNGRYAIRPMDDTSEALTAGSSGYISVTETAVSNNMLNNNFRWTIKRDTNGYYFQLYGANNKTLMTQANGTNIIVYPGTYSSSASCHWSLEEVKGVYLRDPNTMEIIPPSTVKYIVLGEILSLSQLGIDIEPRDDPSSIPTWSPSNESIVAVDSNGSVTGSALGRATITITMDINDVSYSTSYSIYVIPIPDGTYYLRNVAYNTYLQSYDETDVKLFSHNLGTNQRWVFTSIGEGYYSIVSEENGLALSASSNLMTESVGIHELEVYTGESRQQWKITITDAGNYKIKVKSSEGGDSDLALVSSTGNEAVQQIYYNNSDYCDEWIITWDSLFFAEVFLFYDIGYPVFFNESVSDSEAAINFYMQAVADRFQELVGLDITVHNASYFESALDTCKGTVTSDNINAVCTHAADHDARDSVIADFTSHFTESSTRTYVFWSGHQIESVASSGAIDLNRSCSTGAFVFLLRRTSTVSRFTFSTGTLMHELCHQYGVRDHYHEPLENGECKFSDICSVCTGNRPATCIMYNSQQDITADTILCDGCKAELLEHLLAGHCK